MTGIPRTSTNPHVVRSHELYDQRKAEIEQTRNRPKTRRCPVCGSAPGEGFNTYCGTEHMLQGRPRKSREKVA
jgi:formate dehydrogenase maturation protein FdhE